MKALMIIKIINLVLVVAAMIITFIIGVTNNFDVTYWIGLVVTALLILNTIMQPRIS